MVFERETKGAVLYKEVDANGRVVDFQRAKIGSIYLRKSKLMNVPTKITVTVEEAV
jgi:hypothetical protein